MQESVLEDVHEDGFMYDVVMLAPDVRQEHVPTAREKTSVCVCVCVCVCMCDAKSFHAWKTFVCMQKHLYICGRYAETGCEIFGKTLWCQVNMRVCVYAYPCVYIRTSKFLERRFGAK